MPLIPGLTPDALHCASCVAQQRGAGFGGQYWYWFSAGVPAAGS